MLLLSPEAVTFEFGPKGEGRNCVCPIVLPLILVRAPISLCVSFSFLPDSSPANVLQLLFSLATEFTSGSSQTTEVCS